MTWTYSGDPSASDRDAVRFEIGDTDTTDQQLSNEEIAFALTKYSSVVGAAIYCCDALIAKYSRYVNQTVGRVNVAYAQRIAHYQAVIARLRRRAPAATPFIGGQSDADKLAAEEDTDRNAPTFRVGMFSRKS